MEPVSMSWSGGKDSALALWHLQKGSQYEVTSLHTTVNRETQRVGMHGIRKEVMVAQAEKLGLPISFLEIPSDTSNDSYEAQLRPFYEELYQSGIRHIVFGDIFLEDLRTYREQLLLDAGLSGIYPLWGRRTSELARECISAGFIARLCTVSKARLPQVQAGAFYDDTLLSDLPSDVDPCGENGEFHSLVIDGPIFHNPLDIQVLPGELHNYTFSDDKGEKQEVTFQFADILLKS